MKKVHFLAVRQGAIIGYLLAPIRHNRKRLRERGYCIEIYHEPSERCFSCDILCLVSKAVLPLLGDPDPVLLPSSPVVSFLETARQYAGKVIWFDSSDSTGVTHFELLPYVDLYLKKQLFRDRSLYQRRFYGGRIFSEFYHENFGVTDDDPFEQFYPLEPGFSHKVGLSWNIGLGDMRNAFSRRFYQRILPDSWTANYNISCILPDSPEKDIDVFLRTTTSLGRQTIAIHRQELVGRLRETMQSRQLTGDINGERLSSRDFRKTLAKTKIMPSPFGWGELGVRDYEAFIYGALLLKPDMSHMETWPAVFVEGETYQPFEWGFGDLDSTICDLLDNQEERLRIARQGQDAYRDSISPAGMDRFCDWCIQQLER